MDEAPQKPRSLVPTPPLMVFSRVSTAPDRSDASENSGSAESNVGRKYRRVHYIAEYLSLKHSEVA